MFVHYYLIKLSSKYVLQCAKECTLGVATIGVATYIKVEKVDVHKPHLKPRERPPNACLVLLA